MVVERSLWASHELLHFFASAFAVQLAFTIKVADSFDPREEPFGFVSPVVSSQDSKVLVQSHLKLSPQLAVTKMGGSSTEADIELLNALCPGLKLFFCRVKLATKDLCYESMFPV